VALITPDDIRKLAKIAALEVHEDEITVLAQELEAVLTYASSLKEIASGQYTIPGLPEQAVSLPRPVNITRPDTSSSFNSEVLLEAAPEREDNYFVVPVIVKQP
jgi:aspartyl-tRNA(Asn)/glutamyl-tRNA(Gln) amidotransferase subunit C